MGAVGPSRGAPARKAPRVAEAEGTNVNGIEIATQCLSMPRTRRQLPQACRTGNDASPSYHARTHRRHMGADRKRHRTAWSQEVRRATLASGPRSDLGFERNPSSDAFARLRCQGFVVRKSSADLSPPLHVELDLRMRAHWPGAVDGGLGGR